MSQTVMNKIHFIRFQIYLLSSPGGEKFCEQNETIIWRQTQKLKYPDNLHLIAFRCDKNLIQYFQWSGKNPFFSVWKRWTVFCVNRLSCIFLHELLYGVMVGKNIMNVLLMRIYLWTILFNSIFECYMILKFNIQIFSSWKRHKLFRECLIDQCFNTSQSQNFDIFLFIRYVTFHYRISTAVQNLFRH